MMTTRARRTRVWRALLAGGVACVALASCSSSPDPKEQEQKERSAGLPVARQLHDQLYSAGIGWGATIIGGYEECGTDDPLATSDGDSMVQYTAQQEALPFSPEVSFPAFARQVIEALKAAGWQLRQVNGPSDEARYYAAPHGGLDLRLIEFNDPQGAGPSASFHPTATIYVSGKCFDAGSSASAVDLMRRGATDSVHYPIPTTTPIPKYS